MVWHGSLCHKGQIIHDPATFLKQEFLIPHFPLVYYHGKSREALVFMWSLVHHCCWDNASPFLSLHSLNAFWINASYTSRSYKLLLKLGTQICQPFILPSKHIQNYNHIYYHDKRHWNTKEVESCNLRINNKATIIKLSLWPLFVYNCSLFNCISSLITDGENLLGVNTITFFCLNTHSQ